MVTMVRYIFRSVFLSVDMPFLSFDVPRGRSDRTVAVSEISL
jgi:hypothetical protein